MFAGPFDYITVAISATTAKLMCNIDPGKYGPLLYCSDNWNGSQFVGDVNNPTFTRIAEMISNKFQHMHMGGGTHVLAIGGTSAATPDEWEKFINAVRIAHRAKFGTNNILRLFVSTSGFRPDEKGSPNAFALNLFDKVIKQADIVSMSLDELEILHRAIFVSNPEMPAALKLRQLPMERHAIRVVHSPSGAIADVAAVPSGLINHPDFTSNPGGNFLANCLRYAVDGTTAALEMRIAREFTFDQVRGFSGAVTEGRRQLASFNVDFKHPGQMSELPAGMIGCASPYVSGVGRGSLVGLGAQFDSLLLAFLMRSA
jgi:hypothetical protein